MLTNKEKFIEHMRDLLNDKLDDFLSCLDLPSKHGIILNPNKTNKDDFENVVDFDIIPVGFDPWGYYIEDVKLGRHPLHHAGAFYIQDPGAMFTVNSLHFIGNEKVLDMCASPGGKTIQLASRVPNGIVVSNEINKSRSQILYSNVERMGLKNVIITNDTPERISNAYANTFDVCLVDAPCSAEGMIRKDKSILENWNENLTKMCAVRQLDILKSADKALKQDGILIYSTCTYSKDENEDVVNEFKTKYGYELINIDAEFSRGICMPEAVRLYPHETNGEGQFVAVLKKLSVNEYSSGAIMPLKRNQKIEKFLTSILNCCEKAFDFVDFTYIVKDESMLKKGINYVSVGVRAASEEKVIKPNHYLFSAYGNCFKQKLSLDFKSNEVSKYLKGDIFDINLNEGYYAIIVNDIPLGGIKISNGEMKNLYPKGLRNFN